MKSHIRLIAAAALLLAALAVPALVFVSRPPVLIISDAPFIALHGTDRLREQQLSTSLALFRRIKPVMVVESASPDMVVLAATEAAANPYCVLFPRYQLAAARRFHEQFPEIPVVLLGGLTSASDLPVPDTFFSVYTTDRETDLYRAGLFAGTLGTTQSKPQDSMKKSYVLWQDRQMQTAARELFFRGVREQDPEAAIVMARNAAEMPDSQLIAVAVLSGAGADYLEKSPESVQAVMPLILFTWMDPAFTPQETIILFDDSAWALAAPAVRMAAAGQPDGKIPSQPLILPGKITDNGVSSQLKKMMKKMP